MKNRPLINILYGVTISSAIILSVLIVGVNNKLTIDLDSIRSGDIYAGSISKDKLADDVFNTINLQLDDGSSLPAQLIEATIRDGMLTDNLQFQTANGDTYAAKVLNTTLPTNVLDLIPSGAIGEEKLSTVVINKLKAGGGSGGGGGTGSFEIPDGSIVTAKLANNAITTEKLADGSIGTLKLLDGSITSSKLTDGVVLTQHLANSSITTFKIADNAITTSKLLDNIITTVKVQDSAITTPKLANDAITTVKLANGSITTLKIVDGAITEGKLADGSVTAFKLADNAVVTAKISDGAISEAKLASGSISLSKLSSAMCSNGEILQKSAGVWICTTAGGSGVQTIGAGAGLINSGTSSDPVLDANVDNVTIEVAADVLQVKDGAITSSKLADGSVASAKIINGNVTAEKLADNAVTTDKLVDSAVTSEKILDGTITNADISASASIAWSKISKTGSSLADLANRDFADLTGRTANLLSIADTGSYFSANEVEGALQELGAGTFRNGGNAFGSAASLGTTDANTLSILTNNAAAMTILANGNVGIGDSSPLALLTVGADDAFRINNLGVIVSAGGITTNGNVTFNAFNTAGVVTNSASGLLSSTTTLAASFITNNTLNFAQFSNTLLLDASTDISATGSNVLTITNSGSGSSFRVNDQAADTTPFVIDADGNVGIATQTPSAMFAVGGNAFQVNSSGNIARIGNAANSLSYAGGVLNLTSAGALEFRDSTLSAALPLTISDSSLNGALRQGLVDAINDLYTLATTGGGSTLWSLDGNIIYPTTTSRDLALGGNTNAAALFFSASNELLTLTNTTAGVSFRVNDQASDTTPFVIDASGNVGIGTASPGGKLNTVQSGAATATNYAAILENSTTNTSTNGINKYGLQIISTGSFAGGGGAATNNYGLYVNAVTGADNNYAAIFAGGNVGIGTATPADALTVSGNIRLASSGNQLRDFNGNNLLNNTAGALTFGNTTITSQVFTVAAAGSTSFNRNATTDLLINTSGHVAIGSTTATALFNVGSAAGFQVDVSGNIVALGGTSHSIAGNSGLQIEAADTVLALQADGTINVDIAGGSGATGCTINNATGDLTCSGTISGSTGGSYWDRTGTVLSPATADDLLAIVSANTSAPVVSITSNGAVTSGTAAGLEILVSSTSTSVAAAMVTNAGSGLSLVVNDDGTTNDATPFVVDAAGNVGIGTSAPGAKLHIAGGGLRLDNAQALIWRNAANSANISALTMDGSNNLQVQNVNNFQSAVTFLVDTISNRTGNMAVGTTGSNSLALRTNGSSRITILAGGNVGIGDADPASLFTVGASDAFQVNSSGNIVALGGAAHTMSNTSGLTISAAATGLNLQADGAVDVNIAGGAGATGCTINNTTGDLTCSGTVSGASGGSYWGRSGSTLSPASANDVVALVQGGSGLTTVDFKNLSVASAATFDTTATGLSNYSAHFVNTSTESAGSNTLTNVGLYASASGADLNYAAIFGEGNVGIGTSSPAGKLGVESSGAVTATNYTAILQNSTTNTTTNGIDKYGLQIISTGSFTGGAGTATNNYGLYINAVTGADNNYAAIFAGGNVGIGTAAPSANLHIRTDSNATTRLVVENQGTGTSVLADMYINTGSGSGFALQKFGSTNNTTWDGFSIANYARWRSDMGVTGFIITTGAGSNAPVIFGVNDDEKARIVSSGNFGIGGDTTPDSLFSVGATSQFQINTAGNIVAVGGAAHSLTNSSGALNLDSATTGAINIGTSANAKTITIGNTTGASGLVFNSGTGSETFNSSVTTGTGSTSAFVFNANALTSGTGLNINSTSTALTSGTLGSFFWNPGSARVSTGDVLSVDVGVNGVVGYIFNVKNAGSSVFSVSQGQVRSNLPLQVAAAGDVSVAYDLAFTNTTAANIKSNAGLTIQSGEIFNSSDLTLKTFNSGGLVLDTPGGIESLQAQTWTLASSATALNIQAGLLNVDTQNGRVGVGTSSPSALFAVGSSSGFQVNASGAVIAATGLTSSGNITFSDLASCASGLQTDGSGVLSCLPSDSRLKTTVNTLEGALDTVRGLRGVSYHWTPETGLGPQEELGLIAQEVEAVAPQLVFTMGNGYKGVKYSQLTALLVNAIQEQQAQIDDLQASLGLGAGSTMLTEENFFAFAQNRVIPRFTVVKMRINDELIARSVKVIDDAVFYGTADFNNQVNVKNKINVGTDSAGRVSVAAGQTFVDVAFSSGYAEAPIVTISPVGTNVLSTGNGYTIVNATTTGFRIQIQTTEIHNVQFNWIALGINSATPVSYPGP